MSTDRAPLCSSGSVPPQPLVRRNVVRLPGSRPHAIVVHQTGIRRAAGEPKIPQETSRFIVVASASRRARHFTIWRSTAFAASRAHSGRPDYFAPLVSSRAPWLRPETSLPRFAMDRVVTQGGGEREHSSVVGEAWRTVVKAQELPIATMTSSSSIKTSRTNLKGDAFSAVTS